MFSLIVRYYSLKLTENLFKPFKDIPVPDFNFAETYTSSGKHAK
ncbi:hypothetical protein [Foetidibacter luteolus]|nr:hypothetical protein [Foetidibacter luteolus]